MVLVRLMSMVVISLYVVMSVCSFLACFPQEGINAAVSSASVRMCASGSFFAKILNRLSVSIAKKRGQGTTLSDPPGGLKSREGVAVES